MWDYGKKNKENVHTTKITVNKEESENVTDFEFADFITNNNGDFSKEIRKILATAIHRVTSIKSLWHNTSKEKNINILRIFMFPEATYGS